MASSGATKPSAWPPAATPISRTRFSRRRTRPKPSTTSPTAPAATASPISARAWRSPTTRGDLAPQGAESIRALSDGDRLERETYNDIFSGRTFREALLVHSGRPPAPTPALRSLRFFPAIDLEIAEEDGDAFRLCIKDAEIVIRNSSAAPASSTLAELVAPDDEGALAEVDEVLRVAVEACLAAVSTLPVACAFQLAVRPKISPFAAMEALETDRSVTLRHSAFQFAPLQRFLAPLLDGTRTRDDLVAAVAEQARSGALTVSGADGPIAEPAAIGRRLAEGVDSALAGLLRNGLLIQG
jgi:hypothetical protein